jgi:hypothetical protein
VKKPPRNLIRSKGRRTRRLGKEIFRLTRRLVLLPVVHMEFYRLFYSVGTETVYKHRRNRLGCTKIPVRRLRSDREPVTKVQYCLAKHSFLILKRHQLQRNVKPISASSSKFFTPMDILQRRHLSDAVAPIFPPLRLVTLEIGKRPFCSEEFCILGISYLGNFVT